MLYTHDIKKYLLRLGAFALISQPFWILAFNSDDIVGNIFNLNILDVYKRQLQHHILIIVAGCLGNGRFLLQCIQNTHSKISFLLQ